MANSSKASSPENPVSTKTARLMSGAPFLISGLIGPSASQPLFGALAQVGDLLLLHPDAFGNRPVRQRQRTPQTHHLLIWNTQRVRRRERRPSQLQPVVPLHSQQERGA